MTIKDFIEKKVAIAFTNPEQIKEFAKMCEGHNMVMAADKTDAVEWMNHKPEMMFDGITLFGGLTFGKNKFVFLTYDFAEAEMPGGLSWNGNDELNDPHIAEKGWKIVPFEEFKKDAKKRYFSREKFLSFEQERKHYEDGKKLEAIFGINTMGWVDECDGAEYKDEFMVAPNGEKYNCAKKWTVELAEPNEEQKKLDFTHKIEIFYDGEKVTVARMVVNGKEVKTATSHRNPEDKFDFKKGATLAFERLFK